MEVLICRNFLNMLMQHFLPLGLPCAWQRLMQAAAPRGGGPCPAPAQCPLEPCEGAREMAREITGQQSG